MHVLFVNYVSYSVVFFFCSFFRKSRAFSAVYSAHRYEHYIIILALRNRAPRTATQQLIWVRFPPVMILHNAPKTTLDEFCLMKPNERARNACFHVKKKTFFHATRTQFYRNKRIYIYILTRRQCLLLVVFFFFNLGGRFFSNNTIHNSVCVEQRFSSIVYNIIVLFLFTLQNIISYNVISLLSFCDVNT